LLGSDHVFCRNIKIQQTKLPEQSTNTKFPYSEFLWKYLVPEIIPLTLAVIVSIVKPSTKHFIDFMCNKFFVFFKYYLVTDSETDFNLHFYSLSNYEAYDVLSSVFKQKIFIHLKVLQHATKFAVYPESKTQFLLFLR